MNPANSAGSGQGPTGTGAPQNWSKLVTTPQSPEANKLASLEALVALQGALLMRYIEYTETRVWPDELTRQAALAEINRLKDQLFRLNQRTA